MSRKTRRNIAGLVIGAAIALLNFSSALAQPQEKIIYSFSGSDGSVPQAGLISDRQGNLYGTTSYGGALGCCGTAFELTPNSDGTWAEKIIYDFSIGGFTEGNIPWGSLVFDSSGNLYGTTFSGGTSYQGTVYELTPSSGGSWTHKVLYNFSDGLDGGGLLSSTLLIDAPGNLYGMTMGGGEFGAGVVFELIPSANGDWTERVLHSFTGGDDGSTPYASPLTLGSSGRLYGTTLFGGVHDYGVVFELAPQKDGTWNERVIYAFTSMNGLVNPRGGLNFDKIGNLYGVTDFCVFELIPAANGNWAPKILHSFTGGSDGAFPVAAVLDSRSTNIYGTTNSGGIHRGTVFEVKKTAGDRWKEGILHRFEPNGIDGISPVFGALILDSSGYLYGTTPSGGSLGQGIVFQITP